MRECLGGGLADSQGQLTTQSIRWSKVTPNSMEDSSNKMKLLMPAQSSAVFPVAAWFNSLIIVFFKTERRIYSLW